MPSHRYTSYRPPLASKALLDLAVDLGKLEVLDASDFEPGSKFVAYNAGIHGPDPRRAIRIGRPKYETFDEALRAALESFSARRQAGHSIRRGSIWVEELTHDGFGITIWSCNGT